MSGTLVIMRATLCLKRTGKKWSWVVVCCVSKHSSAKTLRFTQCWVRKVWVQQFPHTWTYCHTYKCRLACHSGSCAPTLEAEVEQTVKVNWNGRICGSRQSRQSYSRLKGGSPLVTFGTQQRDLNFCIHGTHNEVHMKHDKQVRLQ